MEENYYLSLLFFLSFIVVVTFFLLSVVSAAASAGYKTYFSSNKIHLEEHKKLGSHYVFDLIWTHSPRRHSADFSDETQRRVLLREDCLLLAKHIRPKLDDEILSSAYDTVDVDEAGYIGRSQIITFLSLLALKSTPLSNSRRRTVPPRQNTFLRRVHTTMTFQVRVKGTVILPWEAAVGIINLAYCIYIYYSVGAFRDAAANEHDSLSIIFNIQVGMWIFVSFFMLDMFLKLAVHGVCGFFRFVPFSEFDTICTLAAVFLQLFPSPFDTFRKILLLLCFLRVFKLGGGFASVSRAAIRIGRGLAFTALEVTAVYLIVLYMYAVIGHAQFGETLNSHTTNKILMNTSWYGSRKQLNFDDLSSSILTLFFCCIGGGWSTLLNASLIAFESSTLPYFYFLSFRVFVGLIFFPLLRGFIIGSYISEWSLLKDEMEAEERDRHEVVSLLRPEGSSYVSAADLESELDIAPLARRMIEKQQIRMNEMAEELQLMREDSRNNSFFSRLLRSSHRGESLKETLISADTLHSSDEEIHMLDLNRGKINN